MVCFVLLQAETHLREVVTLCLDLLLKVRDILGDPVQFILVGLGILGHLLSWKDGYWYFQMEGMPTKDYSRKDHH